jgi:hypothetical protein
VRLRHRILSSLAASAAVSLTLSILWRIIESRALQVVQFPGWFACVLIWGVHGGPENPLAWYAVFSAANVLVYWPIIFGLSFLLKGKSSG